MLHVAIVGFGPRGLVALERVRAHVRSADADAMIDIYDPSDSMGWGVHAPDLPGHLRLNTICAQLTAYTDQSMVLPGAPTTPGPDFFEWVRDTGLKLIEYGETRRPEPTDFMPRGVMGDYLGSVASGLIVGTGRVTVMVHRTAVAAVSPTVGGAIVTTMADGAGREYDLVVIATGHGLRHERRHEIDLDRIAPGRRVLLRGMGLTAMDLVAELTSGRGGRILRDAEGAFTYVMNGAEPRILLTSRSGQLPAARPDIDLSVSDAGDDLLSRGFQQVVERHLGATDDPLEAGRGMIYEALSRALDSESRHRLRRKLNGPTRWPDHEAYERSILADAEWDLSEAVTGIPHSRYKSALESLRTGREQIRHAVDNMAPQQRRAFFSATPGLINRLVIGPQKERIGELLALHRAGVVRFGPGPDPKVISKGDEYRVTSRWLDDTVTMTVDDVIEARTPVAATSLLPSGSLLGCRLHTESGPQRVCVVGPPAEGSSYYNHYIPSPGIPSRAHRELDVILVEVLALHGADEEMSL